MSNVTSGLVEISKPIVTESGETISKLSQNIASSTSQGLSNASEWVKSRTNSTSGQNGGGGQGNVYVNSNTSETTTNFTSNSTV